MLRFAFPVVLCAMLLGGCGGDAAETTTTSSGNTATTTATLAGGDSPLAVVTTWLDALAIGRYPVADVVVVQEQFVLMLAVESFSIELYDELINGGISPEVSRTFWDSFAAGVRGFTGADIREIEVVGAERFEASGRSFAAVEATSPRGDLTIVAVMAADGQWYVDLLATFGSSFAPLFNPWVDRLAGITGPSEALARQRASLEVARDRAPGAAARAELEILLARLVG